MLLPEITFRILCDKCKDKIIDIVVDSISDLYDVGIIENNLRDNKWVSKGKIHICYDCYLKNKEQHKLNLIHDKNCNCKECYRKKLKGFKENGLSAI